MGQTVGLCAHRSFKQIAYAARIAKASGIAASLFQKLQKKGPCVVCQYVPAAFAAQFKDLCQLLCCIIRKMQKTVKTAFQTGVGMDEPLHGLSVAGHDHHQVLPMILHSLEQGIDGFLPVIAATPVGERIGLVDKEHTSHCLLKNLTGLNGRLPYITGHQPATVYFHQLAFGQDPQATVHARH